MSKMSGTKLVAPVNPVGWSWPMAVRRAQGEVEDPKVLFARILMKMAQCYRELAGPVLSPTRVRDVLREEQ
jgi:hypothetical protein